VLLVWRGGVVLVGGGRAYLWCAIEPTHLADCRRECVEVVLEMKQNRVSNGGRLETLRLRSCCDWKLEVKLSCRCFMQRAATGILLPDAHNLSCKSFEDRSLSVYKSMGQTEGISRRIDLNIQSRDSNCQESSNWKRLNMRISCKQ
jgi:hypothetical protein